MNKADRAQLAKAAALIEEAKTIVEEVAEGEQEKFDNLTEGLQAAERGQKMEETASNLSELVNALDDRRGGRIRCKPSSPTPTSRLQPAL